MLVGLAFLFVAYVWPTLYRYDHVTSNGDTYPVRINRFNGYADMLVPDQGWVPVEGDSSSVEDSDSNRTTAQHLGS